mmetsp:Transcript_5102/g.14360  ORF Transcript_5102/g.14360 Transcript_5102/m.14360 type:complete len:164 (-) Transcript_5102:1036-1527(-)
MMMTLGIAERVSKELTGVGQFEAVYWYLFCTQSSERTDAFSSFYGLKDDTIVGSSLQTLSTKGISRKKRKVGEDKASSIASSLDKNTDMLHETLSQRNAILEKSNNEKNLLEVLDKRKNAKCKKERLILSKLMMTKANDLGINLEEINSSDSSSMVSSVSSTL